MTFAEGQPLVIFAKAVLDGATPVIVDIGIGGKERLYVPGIF
jgi:hypothetical protein